MNLLFICSGNKLRSPTAEKVFADKGYNTRSAGTSKNAKNVISNNDIKWADYIFVMEEKHKQRLLAYHPSAVKYKHIEVLDIPNDFKLMEESLINLLNEKVVL